MSVCTFLTYEQLIRVQSSPLWLEMCSWTVTAGFASPAADHTEKRIDLNDHLIQNKDATHLFRVKGDSMIDAGTHQRLDQTLVS